MLSRWTRSGCLMKRKLGVFLYSNSHSTMAMPSIHLNSREQRLRSLLLAVAKSIDDVGNVSEPIVLRWAGGWVRDRLLGIESHDIDVAINAMTGIHFAERMCDYCDTPEAVQTHKIGPDDIGNLHNVARNPDKSKHLETAMVKIFGIDIDFVNLRKETYVEDSRNPQMEFGTAEEDALRRDATINALFYNLHTDCVEDFTGGLPDMDAKLIRTPLDPYQTFMDDPLRVLRLVRFSSRLCFGIDATTERFMADDDVLAALKAKISRERVGVELEKMLRGTRPLQALELIDRLGLYGAIFNDPAKESPTAPDTSRWSVAYKCLDELLQNQSPASIGSLLIRTEDAAYVAWNIAALSPWMTSVEAKDANRKANALPPVASIAREGFKAPNKLTDILAACHKHREEIYDLKTAVSQKKPFILERDKIGMSIRRWDAQGGLWRLQVLSTMLVEAMQQLEHWSGLSSGKIKDFMSGWQAFMDHLQELDVCDAPTMKRLLDGHALAKALQVKPGRWTGKALDVCMEWQLRNPKEKDPAGAIEEVRKRRTELGIPPPV